MTRNKLTAREILEIYSYKTLLHQFNVAIPDKKKWLDEKISQALKELQGNIPTRKWLKDWFEANYLDGDEIQRGQMIASEECFRILLEFRKEVMERFK